MPFVYFYENIHLLSIDFTKGKRYNKDRVI